MIRTKEELKLYFETGDVPTEENFSDLIDTFVTETDFEKVENRLSNFVDLTSEQNITATKTFSGGINMENTTIRKVKAPTANDDAANKQYVDDTIKANIATQVTYSELKSLRDTGNLVSGTQYRITDYNCTTIQENTRSAGHQFDIIVTADDESTLNEVARAVKHDGDTYFANSDLNAWKLWYSLDNDTTRFAWADTTNGKGVIYRMIDEFNNDCPYDFKNILCLFDIDTWAFAVEGVSSYNNIIKPYYIKYVGSTQYAQSINFIHISGSYNRLENQCRNIQLYGSFNVFDSECTSINVNGSRNVFGNACRSIKLFGACYCNVFGVGCILIELTKCEKNEFGSECYEITLKHNCLRNKFAAMCRRITLGQGCVDNVFGQECGNNTLGSTCSRIALGANCDFNTFVNYSRYITLDQGVSYCKFVNNETAASENQVQYYKLTLGTGGSSNSVQNINVTRNNSYETTVAKDSAGNVKQFCIADIIQ